jgi:hypothetical protein
MKFAKSLKPGNTTKYGVVIAAQRLYNGQVQLTLAGKTGNVEVSKYTILRTWRVNV